MLLIATHNAETASAAVDAVWRAMVSEEGEWADAAPRILGGLMRALAAVRCSANTALRKIQILLLASDCGATLLR